ncbi:HTH domain-containing protein [Halobacillus halophilus]|uniref:HTH domain-containing protein n=1 Tax=Halobacillus halophilus TaxID=1570 RepID=UPI00301B8C58
MKFLRKFEPDENLPQLSDLDEDLERFEALDIEAHDFNLSHRNRMICLLYTVKETAGFTAQDIADKFEISRATVYRVVKSGEGKLFIEHLNNQMFENLWGKAVKEMENILDKSHSEQNKLKVIEMIMKSKSMFKGEHTLTVKQEEQELYDHEKIRREVLDMDLDSFQ